MSYLTQRLFGLTLVSLFLLTPVTNVFGDTTLFSDNFDRPDSADVGNGWSPITQYTARLSIVNGKLTDADPTGSDAGVYHPLSYTGPLTVSADLSQESGNAGLTNRYVTKLFINDDGTGNGYGVFFYRGDVNYPSYVDLVDNGSVIASLPSSFQYGAQIHAVVTYNPDGSITGTVSQPGSSYNFSFPAREVVSSGGNFSVTMGEYSTGSGSIQPWVDNLQITGTASTNQAPVIAAIGDKTVDEGENLTFTVNATDPDVGDVLTYAASNLPPGATFDPATHVFSWTPDYGQAGNYSNVEFTVEDNGTPMQLALEDITITVGHVNRPPVFSAVGPQDASTTVPMSFTVSATDPDGNNVALSSSGMPAGSTFDPSTGIFAWTPAYDQAGVYTVTFIATDDGTPTVASSSLDVVISVSASSPTTLTQSLVDTITATSSTLITSQQNSYLANLRKVTIFIDNGQIQAAINQLDAFIQKLNQDYSQGLLSQADYDYYLGLAQTILGDLQ